MFYKRCNKKDKSVQTETHFLKTHYLSKNKRKKKKISQTKLAKIIKT